MLRCRVYMHGFSGSDCWIDSAKFSGKRSVFLVWYAHRGRFYAIS